MHITKRTVIRYISFSAAAVFLTGGLWLKSRQEAKYYKMQLENGYVRSLRDLSSHLTTISNDLDKGQYINSPAQYSQMSARIYKASGSAKSALSVLPVTELQMDNTYRFLSQVGDYSMAISKKMTNGEELSAEELDNAKALREYATKLRQQVDSIGMLLESGQISAANLDKASGEGGDATGGSDSFAGMAGSFESLEQTMTGYPTLIYDGPFSDRILTQKPRLLEGAPEVSVEEAHKSAVRSTGFDPSMLKKSDDENSVMPSYIFRGQDVSTGVTKAGGYVTYMINARPIKEPQINKADAFRAAQKYLDFLDIRDMYATYYEISDGVCTINYAAMQNGVVLYTDLIKVGVALDQGDVVFFDARGYISNHFQRKSLEASITKEQAQESLHSNLAVQAGKLALIPTSGKQEVLTYEFLCTTEEGQKLLVYVNAHTGNEEQILILIETGQGTLTR